MSLDASLLHEFVQFILFLQELRLIDGRNWDQSWFDRNWDRNWFTGIEIEVELQELRSKLIYRNWDLSWWQEVRSKLVTGIEIDRYFNWELISVAEIELAGDHYK